MSLIILGVAVTIIIAAIKGSRAVGAAIIGVFLGGIVGFLLRPSANLVGQLPFGVVITRGATLTDLDVLFRGTAELSFNYMMIGAIIGAVVFIALGKSLDSKQSVTVPSQAPSSPPHTSSANKFCTKCGATLGPEIVFCGGCGTRRN
jgi:hypothetical protein